MSSPWSPAATWRRGRPLLSWPGDEGRYPSRLRARDRDVLLREHVPDAIHAARAPRRDLLELPPVLHGQAEAHGHRRPGGALPEAARAGRARQAREVTSMRTVGGQAVLEGVMMRGPGNWAVAVRTPNGSIAQVSRQIDSAMARHWTLRLPVVRGVMALGESLAIGFRALAISANYAAQDKDAAEGEEVETELSRGALIFAFVIAIGFAIALFKVTPGLITEALPIKSGGWFVIVEGLIRVTLFVAYLALISLLPDLRRVFQYHAAEHKAINAYEAGEELTPERVQRYSQIHVR